MRPLLLVFVVVAVLFVGCDNDGDGFSTTDCDDENADVHPEAVESCNGVDDDCDDFIDDGLVFREFHPDVDGDQFGDSLAPPTSACAAPAGMVEGAGDCDDDDDRVFPGASEVCDDIDNDCDFEIDEGRIQREYRPDRDDDGYGDATGAPVLSCAPVEGLVDTGGDCDDDDPGRNPGAAEICNDIDDDCNGGVDDGLEFSTWYPDLDGDGFGAEGADPFLACDTPEDAAYGDDTDCDDARPEVRPDQTDPCLDCDDGNDSGCRR